MRYRLARWLLGYAPTRLPEGDGAYVVVKSGAVSFIVTAKTFDLERKSYVRPYLPDRVMWREYPQTGESEGTFSGTF